MGRIVSDAIIEAGGIPREFNTIAVDDGIAMGHGGMLYSLPSRDLIADSVEYMVNAHCADALICISNCDKITPGMMMAAMRLNIPTVFVSGGPMEGGTAVLVDGTVRKRLNLISAIADAVNDSVSDEDLLRIEEAVLPHLRFLLGHVHGQLDELPHRGPGPLAAGQRHHAGHAHRPQGAVPGCRQAIVGITNAYYYDDDESVLPRAIAGRAAFENAMTMDIAMGGSSNTILHLLAAAQEAELDFTLEDIDAISRRTPCLTKVAPNGDYLVEDVHRAGGIPAILGELDRGGMLRHDVRSVHGPDLRSWLDAWDIRGGKATDTAVELFHAAPGCVRSATAFSQSERWDTLDTRRRERLYPLDRERPHRGGRPGRAPGQHLRGWLRGEDGRRGRIDLQVLRPGRGLRITG